MPKSLTRGGRHTGGRNNTGRITCFHRGGGMKTVHRIIHDLAPFEVARILGIQWDPNRTAPIALAEMVSPVSTTTSSRSSASRPLIYLIAGEGLRVNQEVTCGTMEMPVDMMPNNKNPLGTMPIGTRFFHFSLNLHQRYRAHTHTHRESYRKGIQSKTALTPGAFAEVLRHNRRTQMTRVRLPSGEQRWVFSLTMATIGQVGAKDHALEMIGKAGTTRRRGIRPTVRGCAMNPVDHPHGGRTKGGLHDVTPWSKIAKGQPTRNPRRPLGFTVKTSRSVRMNAKKA